MNARTPRGRTRSLRMRAALLGTLLFSLVPPATQAGPSGWNPMADICTAQGAILASALASAGAARAGAPRVVSLPLVGGRLAAVDGISDNTLKLHRGDEVELRWRSDRPIVLHLHGYDLERRVAPDAPASMAFKASIPGRFPVSEHRSGGGHREGAVLYVEVHP